MVKDGRADDLYGENDIPKSKILDIELYMDKHAKEMVDFLEKKTVEDYTPDMTEIYHKLLRQLVEEFPFGKTEDGGLYYDKVHVILANALTASLWCGWLSQSTVDRNEPKINEQYLEHFGRAITKAYDIGRKYANRQKLDEDKEPPTTENE
jgi:hypothetical protein